MRLETLSRTLAEAFHQASGEKRRRAVLLACEMAVAKADLHGTAVEAALGLIRDGVSREATRLELQGLSERLDDDYLQLQDQDEPAAGPQALLSFRKARAAAALAFALSADPADLHEALYEAAFASENEAEVVSSVEAALV